MKIIELKNLFFENLSALYPENEIRSLFEIALEKIENIKRHEIFLKLDYLVENEEEIWNVLKRLIKSEPIQYIFGEAYFYHLKFKVNSSTLIPRSETEELVQLIVNENVNKQINILDIGTGSGCIALSLKKNLQQAQVFALDFSENALEIARLNAQNLNLKIDFFLYDILKYPEINFPITDKLNVIVSNPPYVRESEKTKMHKNVLEFEPHSALFVSDNEPLLYYSAISNLAFNILNTLGKIYFEINENFGEECKLILEQNGFSNCKIHLDLNNKTRFVSGVKA